VNRFARLATAAALAVALVTVPLVADWCALSCETAHGAASGGAPACHHQGTASPRIADRPTPCSHDHHPVVVDAETMTAIPLRAICAIAAPAASIADETTPGAIVTSATRDADPHSPPFSLTLADLLRV